MDATLYIGTTGSHVPYKSLIRLRAAYMPDAAREAFRPTPELIPEARRTSGFDITSGVPFTHLSGPYLTGFAATPTTTALDDHSLQWFEACHPTGVPPKKTDEIVWNFTKPGEFEFSCLIPGIVMPVCLALWT